MLHTVVVLLIFNTVEN